MLSSSVQAGFFLVKYTLRPDSPGEPTGIRAEARFHTVVLDARTQALW